MKTRRETGRGFADYYVNQAGHGMPVFTGASMQRGYGMPVFGGAAMQQGHGIGSILKGLFRVASPLIASVGRQALKKSKPILKEVGKHALKRGIQEMSRTKNPKLMRMVGEVARAVTIPAKQKKIPKRGRSLGRRRGRAVNAQTRDIFDK